MSESRPSGYVPRHTFEQLQGMQTSAWSRLEKLWKETSGGLDMPSGWTIQAKERESGASKGEVDYFLFSPEGRRFKSPREVVSIMLKQVRCDSSMQVGLSPVPKGSPGRSVSQSPAHSGLISSMMSEGRPQRQARQRNQNDDASDMLLDRDMKKEDGHQSDADSDGSGNANGNACDDARSQGAAPGRQPLRQAVLRSAARKEAARRDREQESAAIDAMLRSKAGQADTAVGVGAPAKRQRPAGSSPIADRRIPSVPISTGVHMASVSNPVPPPVVIEGCGPPVSYPTTTTSHIALAPPQYPQQQQQQQQQPANIARIAHYKGPPVPIPMAPIDVTDFSLGSRESDLFQELEDVDDDDEVCDYGSCLLAWRLQRAVQQHKDLLRSSKYKIQAGQGPSSPVAGGPVSTSAQLPSLRSSILRGTQSRGVNVLELLASTAAQIADNNGDLQEAGAGHVQASFVAPHHAPFVQGCGPQQHSCNLTATAAKPTACITDSQQPSLQFINQQHAISEAQNAGAAISTSIEGANNSEQQAVACQVVAAPPAGPIELDNTEGTHTQQQQTCMDPQQALLPPLQLQATGQCQHVQHMQTQNTRPTPQIETSKHGTQQELHSTQVSGQATDAQFEGLCHPHVNSTGMSCRSRRAQAKQARVAAGKPTEQVAFKSSAHRSPHVVSPVSGALMLDSSSEVGKKRKRDAGAGVGDLDSSEDDSEDTESETETDEEGGEAVVLPSKRANRLQARFQKPQQQQLQANHIGVARIPGPSSSSSVCPADAAFSSPSGAAAQPVAEVAVKTLPMLALPAWVHDQRIKHIPPEPVPHVPVIEQAGGTQRIMAGVSGMQPVGRRVWVQPEQDNVHLPDALFEDEDAAQLLAEGLGVAYRRRKLVTQQACVKHAEHLLRRAAPCFDNMAMMVSGLQQSGMSAPFLDDFSRAVKQMRGALKLLAGVPQVAALKVDKQDRLAAEAELRAAEAAYLAEAQQERAKAQAVQSALKSVGFTITIKQEQGRPARTQAVDSDDSAQSGLEGSKPTSARSRALGALQPAAPRLGCFFFIPQIAVDSPRIHVPPVVYETGAAGLDPAILQLPSIVQFSSGNLDAQLSGQVNTLSDVKTEAHVTGGSFPDTKHAQQQQQPDMMSLSAAVASVTQRAAATATLDTVLQVQQNQGLKLAAAAQDVASTQQQQQVVQVDGVACTAAAASSPAVRSSTPEHATLTHSDGNNNASVTVSAKATNPCAAFDASKLGVVKETGAGTDMCASVSSLNVAGDSSIAAHVPAVPATHSALSGHEKAGTTTSTAALNGAAAQLLHTLYQQQQRQQQQQQASLQKSSSSFLNPASTSAAAQMQMQTQNTLNKQASLQNVMAAGKPLATTAAQSSTALSNALLSATNVERQTQANPAVMMGRRLPLPSAQTAHNSSMDFASLATLLNMSLAAAKNQAGASSSGNASAAATGGPTPAAAVAAAVNTGSFNPLAFLSSLQPSTSMLANSGKGNAVQSRPAVSTSKTTKLDLPKPLAKPAELPKPLDILTKALMGSPANTSTTATHRPVVGHGTAAQVEAAQRQVQSNLAQLASALQLSSLLQRSQPSNSMANSNSGPASANKLSRDFTAPPIVQLPKSGNAMGQGLALPAAFTASAAANGQGAAARHLASADPKTAAAATTNNNTQHNPGAAAATAASQAAALSLSNLTVAALQKMLAASTAAAAAAGPVSRSATYAATAQGGGSAGAGAAPSLGSSSNIPADVAQVGQHQALASSLRGSLEISHIQGTSSTAHDMKAGSVDNGKTMKVASRPVHDAIHEHDITGSRDDGSGTQSAPVDGNTAAARQASPVVQRTTSLSSAQAAQTSVLAPSIAAAVQQAILKRPTPPPPRSSYTSASLPTATSAHFTPKLASVLASVSGTVSGSGLPFAPTLTIAPLQTGRIESPAQPSELLDQLQMPYFLRPDNMNIADDDDLQQMLLGVASNQTYGNSEDMLVD